MAMSSSANLFLGTIASLGGVGKNQHKKDDNDTVTNCNAHEKDTVLIDVDQRRDNDVAPFSEAQPSCPTCGEVFSKIFRNGEWYCTDVVVIDVLKREQVFIPLHLKSRLSPHCLVYHKACLPKLPQFY